MIKAFIFDLDGVLVDTAKYHFRAWKELGLKIGFEINQQDNEQLKGVSRKESLDIILAWANLNPSLEQKIDMMEFKNKFYLQLVETINSSLLLTGAREILEESKKLGLKIGLGSASTNAIFLLEKTNILQFFDAVVDGNKTTKSKPHPQVFLLGSELLGVKPEEIVVFEDSIAGLKAAKFGNFKSVGIGDKANLNLADLVYSGLNQIDLKKILAEF